MTRSINFLVLLYGIFLIVSRGYGQEAGAATAASGRVYVDPEPQATSGKLRFGRASAAAPQVNLEGQVPAVSLSPVNRLRVIMFADREASEIEEAVEIDAERFQAFIQYVFDNPNYPRLRGRATVYDWNRQARSGGKVARISQLTEYFRQRPLAPNEGILFYYSGHGGIHNSQQNIRAQTPSMTLTTSVGNEDRRSLKEILLAQKAPLVYFITDMCATYANIDFARIQKGPVPSADLERAYETIFLRQRGILDITSSCPGEASLTHSSGSIFTDALLSVLSDHKLLECDQNRDGVLVWPEVLPYVQRETSNSFLELKRRVMESPRSTSTSTFLQQKGQNIDVLYMPFHENNGGYFTDATIRKYPPDTRSGQPSTIAFSVYAGVLGKKGRNVTLAVYFSDSRGIPIPSITRRFVDRRGNVAVSKTIGIATDDETLTHITLTLPESELSQSGTGTKVFGVTFKLFDGDKLMAATPTNMKRL